MSNVTLSPEDERQIADQGKSPQAVKEQLKLFARGMPPARLARACTLGDGIVALDSQKIEDLTPIYDEAMSQGRASKFVPASGASSRMFKSLLALLTEDLTSIPDIKKAAQSGNKDAEAGLVFLSNLHRFAFYETLRNRLAQAGENLGACLAEGRGRPILEGLLTDQGLDYAALPKALIEFHRYPDRSRTPLDEHLVEAVGFIRDEKGECKLHFTVSPEHRERIESYVRQALDTLQEKRTRFHVSFSMQKPATDTIAADSENRPFHDKNGSLVFRPGGHGALLENLQDLQGDIVFLKNIDNVVPEKFHQEGIRYRKAMGGLLISLQKQIFVHLETLEQTGIPVSEAKLSEIEKFITKNLGAELSPGARQATAQEKRTHFKKLLHRPLRVCGMVKNQGEPGGGPFWVSDDDGGSSVQIVESSQFDSTSEAQMRIAESATHFNPVDIVCGLRDRQGKAFRLLDFRDPDSAFISVKSKDGQELKALELPGLWNGSMAFWNTVFVEIPVEIFNPVKTVNDLLRPYHAG